ncbi:hypothetical protein I79_003405 [Cricetulus griseus]|uniref:Uncharacterized protein n=1 Tax=Cricetulus griseus TaxID=10029 RepID=G3GZV8_CRIGR|nr:hypothetical protein I79_003405 [Cricetulus griseus]
MTIIPTYLVSKHPRVPGVAGNPAILAAMVTDGMPMDEAPGKGPCITMTHWFHDI